MAGGGFTGHDVHIDVPLSQVAMAYTPKNLIAEALAPIVNVNKQSDSYYVWDIADAYRLEDDKRAPGTEANIIERSVSSETYFAKNYALKDKIPYEDLKNADKGFLLTARNSRVKFIKDKLYLNWEYRVAQKVNSGSNVGSYTTVASGWTETRQNYSDPVGCINTGIDNVEGVRGIRPNRIVFGGYAWRYFRQHKDVLDRIFGTGTRGDRPKLAKLKDVADLFEVDQVLIGGGYYNSADEGQSSSLTRLWNDNVLIYYAPDRPTAEDASFMYSFRWNEVPGMNMQAEVFNLPRAKAEQVQLGYYQDEKITDKYLGFLITGVGSSQ